MNYFPGPQACDVIRLGLAAAAFVASLLAVFRAPTTLLWLGAIAATEFGHWFVFAPLGLLFWKSSGGLPGHCGSLLAAGSVVLLLSPLGRALLMCRRIERELLRVFPGPAVSGSALSLPALWLGKKTPPVTAEKFSFATHADQTLHLDFYRSVRTGPSPCVVVIHGGGWNNGNPDEFLEFNAHLARRGFAVAAMEYRLAPRWQWPAQRDDVLDAMAYLRSHAAELGIDPARFVLMGRSAGGQIAEAVAYSIHDPSLRGLIAFYAPADMHFAFEFARSDDILNSLQLLRDYLGGDPVSHKDSYDSASGIGLISAASPPTLLLHGRRDELVWCLQSRRLAAKLQQAGVPSYLVELDWATHAFDYNPRSPGGQISTRAVDRFLDSVTAQ